MEGVCTVLEEEKKKRKGKGKGKISQRALAFGLFGRIFSSSK